MQPSDIAIISCKEAAPIPLTDRFGEYVARKEFKNLWAFNGAASQNYENLRGHYYQGEMDVEGNSLYAGFSVGDPRNHLHWESSFVAVHNEQLGILVEIELGAHYNGENGPIGENDLTDAEFIELASILQGRLAELSAHYPHTQFFITHGNKVTLEGRIVVNAFTPLLDGELPGGLRLAPEYRMVMISPYFTPGEGADITSCRTLYRVAVDLEQSVADLAADKQENAA
ncbi:hypothetical protein [Marinobacter sp.]|uniref:hypothetical protein n=1 Tax=Marinobacter sp. TaxID=50741 RepID=UPI0035657CA9